MFRRSQKRVFIAVPTYSGSVSMGVADFVGRCKEAECKYPNRFAFEWMYLPHVQPVEYARNALVSGFLRSELSRFDWIWFVDDDMRPPRNALDLLSVDAHIITGSTTGLVRNPGVPDLFIEPAFLRQDNAFMPIAPDATVTAPLQIDACGTSFTLFHRDVFAKTELPNDDPKFAEAGIRTFFRTQRATNGALLLSEDIDFTWRAKQAGFTVALHPGVKVGHGKLLDVNAHRTPTAATPHRDERASWRQAI